MKIKNVLLTAIFALALVSPAMAAKPKTTGKTHHNPFSFFHKDNSGVTKKQSHQVGAAKQQTDAFMKLVKEREKQGS